MDTFNSIPFLGETETRNELIAMAQLVALHLDESLFHSDEPLIIILNGTESSGKSLIPSAFGAQLGEIRTSNVDIIGETTWQSENDLANLRLHFIDASVVCDNPMEILRGADGLAKDLGTLKRELKEKGDVIFLQNVPTDEFGEIADMEIVVTRNGAEDDWQRLSTIIALSARVMKGDFAEFFESMRVYQIKEAAAQLPDDYLLPDGEVYGPILQG